MSVNDFVLGIDGGGTTTVAWLASREGHDGFETFGHAVDGPSNQRVVGFDTASRHVNQAIDQAFASAGMNRCEVQSACLAMAGCDRPVEREQWFDWAKGQAIASQKVVVTNDAESVIFAANPTGQGVALIAGTGSLALGRLNDGTTARAGGWGPLIGDEGSGYGIAIEGLRSAGRAADGRAAIARAAIGRAAIGRAASGRAASGLGEATELLPRFCEALGASDPTQIISRLYSADYDRPRIASLASIVFDAAADNDPIAVSIIDHAANELALAVAAVTNRLKLDSHRSVLAITGGVALNQPDYVKQITTHLKDNAIVFGKVSIEKFPVAGAVQMAIASANSCTDR